jgi:hypothetical protein
MIAEMMAEHIATNVATLKAVRPVAAGQFDQYPHVIYETVDMRNIRYLNCTSKQYEGTVRFYVCGLEYDDVSTLTETLKDLLIGYSQTGPVYRIRRCDLVDEGDVGQEQDAKGQDFYVKSIDIAVKALKVA